MVRFASAAFIACIGTASLRAQPIQLPTSNRAIFEPGGEPRFFAGTAGKPWTSGTFGCVRTEGWQMHEGLDIRATQFDKLGEPTDPILASADGVVGYINRRPSLSNYGNYIILRHLIEGLEICSLYAHLDEIRTDLKIGATVRAGEQLGVMGRTSNTRQRITKDRAHVHFELDFIINDRFAAWFKKHRPGERNDHGNWNGGNLIAIDPRAILLLQKSQGAKFSLLNVVRGQTELCRVFVRASTFPWLKRYAPLVRPNPKSKTEAIIGYEIALNFNGLPFELIPRTASEIKGASRIQLLSVNEAEYRANPCRRIVSRRGASWQLTTSGTKLIELLIYN
jgi:peptidoglycan LD-endopeptidase LytH